MPRPATGELRPLSNGWEARIRIEGKKRRGFALLTSLSDEDAASRCRAMALIAQRLSRAGHSGDTEKLLEWAARVRPGGDWEAVTTVADSLCGGKAPPKEERASVTFGELATDWTSGKLHATYPDSVELKESSDTDAMRLGKWVYPLVEHIALHAFTEEHAQEVMRRIPTSKSRATRRHVGQLMTRVLNLAVYPCKYIDRSPIPKGFLPRLGKAKALAYLYPDEDRKLLACTDVPFAERLLFGLLAREGLRCEEALSLRWQHLDLVRGSIRVDINKTDDPRAWALDPGVVKALLSWKAQHPDADPGDRVFSEAPTRLASRFRGYLKIAGVKRAELFERTDVRRPIRAHDLRATFVTVNLANGKTESWICDRTGHSSSSMVNRYRRSARAHSELGQGNLTPLDEALATPHQRPMAVATGGVSGDLGSATIEEPAIAAECRPAIGDSSGCDRTLRSPADGDSWGARGAFAGSPALLDPVELALARALEAATAAGRFDVVAQLARELEARRLAHEPNVVTLVPKRRR